jgi:hypothetical protein
VSRAHDASGHGPPTPFVLASGTSSAFLLLISVVFTVPTVWRPAVFDRGSHIRSPSEQAEYARCVEAIFAVPGQLRHSSPECMSILNDLQDLRLSVVLAFGVLCLLTVVQYWFGPAWRIHRRRLQPIERDTFPALCEELDRMTDQVLTNGRVHFLLDIVNPAVDGLAFGRVGRRYIVLSRGMLALFERDLSVFRAVLLHELAHVRNRDLDITAVTLAAWRSFLVMLLVPGLMTAALGIALGTVPTANALRGGREAFVSGPGLSWLLAAQLTGLAGLAWLTRYTVLQARELHADARMLTWQPDPVPLRQLFYAIPKRRWSVAALRRRTHPSLTTRVAALTDTSLLLRQGFAFSFALGACFSLSMDAATSLTATLRSDQFYWPAEAFVFVLTVALGIRALRAAAYNTAPETAVDGLRSRLGLAAGLPLGWALAPSRMSDHVEVPFPVDLQLASLLLLAGAGWLLGQWVQWVMTVWTPKIRAATHPARAAVVPITLVVLLVLLYARPVYQVQTWVIISHVLHEPAASDPIVLVLLVAQRVLDAQFIGKSVLTGVPGWFPVGLVLLMIPLAHRSRLPETGAKSTTARPSPRPRYIAFAGILAGVFVGVLAVAVWTAADRTLLGIHSGTDFVAVGSGIGTGLAAAVTVWARNAPVAKALCAGLISGLLVDGLLYLVSASGRISWQLLTLMLGRTLESALLAGLAASALLDVLMTARGKMARPRRIIQ